MIIFYMILGAIIGFMLVSLAFLNKRVEDYADENICRNIDNMVKDAEHVMKIYAKIADIENRLNKIEQVKKGEK